MKKSIIVLFVLIFLTVSTAFAYDIEWTLVGNIPFGARTYECVNNVCEQPSMNFVQEKQGSAVQLNFQGSATQANPDYYALYLWPQDMCHVPTAFHIELYGSATWTSNVNFFKKPSTECGSNVENIQATATEVQVGETVIVTADLESMFYPADNLVTYIPSDLVDYYDSIVDVFFTVNGISVDQDQFNIGYEEHWKQVSYDFTPTQPGTYVLRIASKMDNDCKCNQPSNYKYREVIVEVPEPPTYCGDEEVQQPNDDGLFEYCDNDAEGPGVQCLEECRMDALWDDDECSCCGDAVVNGDETCDPNDPTGPTNCRTTGDVCTYCGDSIIQTGEECDDGNDVNDDFCSNECTTNECRLNLTKVDDPDPVEPGELLNYKINITNVGEKACDGAGYEIIEYYDLYTDFFGAEPWPSFSDFIWLFMNLDLGESQLVDINVTVSETVECGQVLYNEVCTYVYETDIETCIIENTTVVCPPGCLEGYKRDSVNIGLPGWNITVQNILNPNLSYSTITDGTGHYKFDNLPVGQWTVREETQSGWELLPGYSDIYLVNVTQEQECTQRDFFNQQVSEIGCVNGLKRDDNHTGLQGWTIHAQKNPSGSVYTTTTNENGTFSFTGLQTGVYEFWEEMQPGWEAVTAPRFNATVISGQECIFVAFKNKPLGPYCGDNNVDFGEDCDDGANGIDTDGCFDNCTFTYCGDDIIQTPNGFGLNETCDDGVLNGLPNQCNEECSGTTDPFCGNNVTEPGEDCDDGANGISTDGCFDNCTFTYCGDGVIQVPNGFGLNETCDDGILNGLPNQCNEECTGTTPPFCGNNITEAGEDCDDGSNGIDTDGCFDDCTLTYCGDNIIQTPNGFGQNEECDDGNNIDDDGCSAICEIEPYCGDGNLDPGEECEFDYHCIDGDPSTIDTCSNCECDNTVLYGCLEGYKRDSVEVGLPGWNITATNIYNSNLTYSILTDGTGHYIFNSLPIGEWSVREEMQEYWEVLPGYSDIYLVNVTEGETCTQQDFFNQQVSRIGCVEGLKRDENHTGLEGWVIHAQKINETLVYTTVSNENGTFSFTGLEAGLYEFWEDMKPDWEAVTLPRFNATVIAGEECIQIAFKNRETCIDECQLGRYCVNNSIYECGDYDEDSCLELREEENCDYYNETEAYYECQLDYSHGYRNITEGFCNNYPEPFCDFNTYSENVSDEYCGVTECNSWEYCEDNDVYSGEECTFRGCEIITGLCFENNSTNTTLIEDCGENETSTEVCYFQNLTYTLTEYFCVEDNDNAFCDSGFEEVVVEDCGPDICVEYTDMNIFVKEYVHDEETCENDECVPDPGDFYDYCITESLLNQSLCLGNDYSYEEFDCDSLDQCYEFVCEECVCCSNPYDGLCEEVTCQKIGMRFIDYYCEDGACGYNDQEEMIDVDGDMIDDRCDDCMDVDQDGTCDDVDNCVGVYNPTQVDEDRDGYGNACDNDRDGDGYPANEDCDDWNAEVNPGVEEIKNNGRDDDCNPDTEDKGEYTARQALHVDAQYDESLIEPGKGFTIVVTATNQHEKRLDDLQLMVSIPGFQEKQAKLVRELGSGNSKSRSFTIEMPRNFNSEYEELRVSVSNDKYRRTVYRELKLPK